MKDLFQSHLGSVDSMVRGHSRREQLRQSAQNLKLTRQVARTVTYTDPALCRIAFGGGWNSPAANAGHSKKYLVAS